MADIVEQITSIFGGTVSVADAYADSRKGSLTNAQSLNLVLQTAAMGGGLVADATPAGGVIAVSTGYAALTSQSAVLGQDLSNLRSMPVTAASIYAVIGDGIGLAGDAVQILAAAANSDPLTRPLGLVLDGIGNDLTLASIATTNDKYFTEVLSTAWSQWSTDLNSELDTAESAVDNFLQTTSMGLNSDLSAISSALKSSLTDAQAVLGDSSASAEQINADAETEDSSLSQTDAAVASFMSDAGETGENVEISATDAGAQTTNAEDDDVDLSGYVISTNSTTIGEVTDDQINDNSESQILNNDDTLTTYDYDGQNQSENLTEINTEYDNGASQVTTYNSDNTASTTTDYSGPNGSGMPASSTTMLQYTSSLNGQIVTFRAGVSLAQSLFILPAQRVETPGTATFGTTATFVAGNLNPNTSNTIEIEANTFSTTPWVSLSPMNVSAMLSFSTHELEYATAGQYNNVRLNDGLSYDGSAFAYDGLEYDIAIYAPAVADVDFSSSDPAPSLYFHVGDVAIIEATVANVASGALSDSLVVGAADGDPDNLVASVAGGGDIEAGQSAAVSVGLNTSNNGSFDLTSDNLSLISHDNDLPDIPAQSGGSGSGAGSELVHIMAYADPLIAEAQGSANATLTQTAAGTWKLSFGYQIYDPTGSTGSPQQVIDIQNGTSENVIGDNLQGSLSASSPGVGFKDSYALPLNGGNETLESYATPGSAITIAQLSPYLTVLGAQAEIVTYDPVGFNASGYSGALPAETLTITDNVVSSSAIPIAMFEVDQSELDSLSSGFQIDDSIANIASDLQAIEADPHLTGIVTSAGTKVKLSGDVITATNPDGSRTVSTYNTSRATYLASAATYTAAGGLLSQKTYNAAGQLTSLTYPTQTPTALTTPTRSDLLFQSQSGELATWQVDDAAITGGGTIGDPGADWTYEGSGDFYGDGDGGLLFKNQDDELAIWEVAGTQLVGGGAIGNPGGTWNVVGVGDFNSDGSADILFEDAGGDLAVWEMNGTSIVGGATLGNPGPGWTFLGLGDFNADGTSDLLFRNASGTYATWEVDDGAVVGGAALGQLGSDWVYKGVGNFDGLGDSDILFENATTGQYATWDVSDDAIVGGGAIGTPGPDWAFASIEDTTANGRSDILFRNVQTGQYATWDLDDTTITGGGVVGNPGDDFALALGPPAATAEPAPTLVFRGANGALATWTVANGAIAGGGGLGSPGAAWSELAVGDFWGDGQSDVLFENAGGTYAIWRTDGTSVNGGGAVGALTGWTFEGLGDFDGDGTSDMLFQNNATGAYATWLLNGTEVIGGATLGSPGAGFTYKGTGDFTGLGTSDILFEDASGSYWISDISNDATIATAEIGSPGAGWTLAAIGDLNGDGKADLVFENATGTYASWDLNGAAIVGGGTLGNPGPSWTLVGVADLNPADHASLVFANASTGAVATWEVNDTSIVGGGLLGTAAGFTLLAAR